MRVLSILLLINTCVQLFMLWHTMYLVREIVSVKTMALDTANVLSTMKTAAVGGVLDKTMLVKGAAQKLSERVKTWMKKPNEGREDDL